MPFNNEEEIQAEREKWNLTDEEFQDNFNSIFNELILIGNASPSSKPTFIMVGGQAGCGKSMLVGKELRALPEGAIAIDQDVLRTKHPKYQQIHNTYTEREEFLLLKRYIDRIVKTAIDKSSAEGYNLILESALRSVSKFIEHTKELKAKGYDTKLSVLAVSPDEANLSMFTRFCEFLDREGECRRNTRVDNDSVEKIPQNISNMDNLGIFDDITISVRGTEPPEYLPTQVYSKKQSPEVPTVQVYLETINKQRVKPEDFERRYIDLRGRLSSYGQEVQVKRLDEFHDDFVKRNPNEQYPNLDD